MSTRSQRGRAIHTKKSSSPLRIFYVLIGVVALVGIAVLGTMALRNGQNSASPGALLNRPPLNAPTGKTAEGYYYKGQPNAPVTVVEYSDFQCPFCGRFATGNALAIDRDYVETGKIKYIFHDFPLQQHPNAVPAAEAARCAGDQNAFWPMHDMLFANQSQWENSAQPQSQFVAYAQQLKLDSGAFERCLSSGTQLAFITKAQQEGGQIQIPGTPTFVIDGKQYNADELRGAIDAALKRQ
jgi:protein-disulfide isomerase